MDKQRFVLAIVLSAAILLGWSLLNPVKTPPPQDNTNANTATAQPSSSPTASPQATGTNPETTSSQAETPNCTLGQETDSIEKPLYRVKLDRCGAVATQWIIDKNKENNRPLRSISGNELDLVWQGDSDDKKPGQFETPLFPLRLETGNEKVDRLLATSRYSVVDRTKDEKSETIEFSLKSESLNLEVRKKIIFYDDQYGAGIQVRFSRLVEGKDQSTDDLPKSVKLLIGPSIGDQGIQHYTFYSIPPEGVASIGDKVGRHNAQAINQKSDRESVVGLVDWAAVGDTYFTMAAVPKQKLEGLEYRTTMVTHLVPGKNGQSPSTEPKYLITAAVPISTDGSPTRLYVGPKDHYLLDSASTDVSKAVERPVDLEAMIDYGFLSWLSRPLAVPILACIKFLYKITGSYGIAIILFTIVIYSLFFPLKWRSSKAMKKAQKLAPRMKELQAKIKGMKKTDPRLKELQMEQMRLMKEGNPLGGCLPLLIQMPFLFALYRAITISIDFRQAPFLWINDLSAAEPTMIHILPLLMAASMMVLQLITPAPSADPTQRKLMAIGMPLLMLWMLWSAPAGLLVYWLVGNLVGFGQQFLINRLTKTKDDELPPSGKKAETRSTKKLNARVSQA
jgi:YidC/Oxa1 family membrane protein insertase